MSIPPSSPSSTTSVSDGEGSISKKPYNRSALGSIFDQIFLDMKRLGFTGNIWDGNTTNSYFKLVMDEWTEHYNSHQGQDKFYPVFIPNPHTTVTPTTTPERKKEEQNINTNEDDFIPLYWDVSVQTIRFGKIKDKRFLPPRVKCCKCWSIATSSGHLCNPHSTTRTTYLALLHDENESDHHYYACINYTRAKKQTYNQTSLMMLGKSNKMKLFGDYLASHVYNNFTPIYEQSVLSSSSERETLLHTTKVTNLILYM